MDRDAACGCAICFGFPFLIWIIIMIVLASRSYTPTCSIQDLYIPALNAGLPNFNSSTTSATFIFFDIELDNAIESDGVRYEYGNVSLAFHYGRKAGFPVANYTVPGVFHLGDDEETAHLRDVVETGGMPWRDAIAEVSGGSTAAFTVELATRVKVKREVGHSREKELRLRADVEVNNYGEKVQKKAIKLIRQN